MSQFLSWILFVAVFPALAGSTIQFASSTQPLVHPLSSTCEFASQIAAPDLEEVEKGEILRQLQERPQYHDLKSIEKLKHGGESIVMMMRFPNRASQVLILQRNPDGARSVRPLTRAMSLMEWVHSSGLDPEGSSHLPNYCECIQFETSLVPKRVGLVWEYAVNGTLADHIDSNRFMDYGKHGLRDLLNVWEQVALGVRALKRHNLVHGDIKAANILITLRRNDKTKSYVEFYILSDLGFIGDEGEQPVGIPPGHIFGTRSYLNKKRLEGGPLTHKSDVYALKVVYLETLLGSLVTRMIPKPTLPISEPEQLLPDRVREKVPRAILKILDPNLEDINDVLQEIHFAQRELKL